MILVPFSAIFIACVIWGFSPLVYRLLDHITPEIIMTFRIIFSFIFLFFFVAASKKTNSTIRIIKNLNTFLLILFASIMIGINQFGFIYSISIDQVLQASFAYYVFPLIAILFGFIFFKERFTIIQFIAIIFALISVILLSLGMQSIPLISIIMGTTFAVYGLLKKKMDLDPLITITIEIFLLCPLAFGFLLFTSIQFPEKINSLTQSDYYLLLVSGLITALPLYLFSFATQKLNYSTVGLINYLNPTLQFLVAVFIFSEPFSSLHLLSFTFIWFGLLLYSFDSIISSFFKSKKISSTVSQTLK